MSFLFLCFSEEKIIYECNLSILTLIASVSLGDQTFGLEIISFNFNAGVIMQEESNYIIR